MAPEQLARSEATPRSDVYSLGLVLMEMLTGKLPWGGASGDAAQVEHALQRLVQSPSPLRELAPEQPFSDELQQLASDVLSQDPSQRPADAGELLRRIRKLPEMREWQRLPRRLSRAADRDETPVRVREAVPANVPEQLTEKQTEKLPDKLPDKPTSKRADKSQSDWPSTGSVTEINDWTEEPTVPAGSQPLEQQIRSLEAALLADSRQSRAPESEFDGDTIPTTTGPTSVPSFEAAQLASQRSLRNEDSHSNSNSNSSSGAKAGAFSASELARRLQSHEANDPPSLPPSPTREERPPAAPPPPAATAAVPEAIGAKAATPSASLAIHTSKVALPAPVRRPPPRWLVTSLAVLAVVLLKVPIERILAALFPSPVVGAVGDLRKVGAVDASVVDLQVADLAEAVDLYRAPDALPALDLARADSGPTQRVRFVFTEDDGTSKVSCEPRLGEPTMSTQRGKTTIHVTLVPGSVCAISGPAGSQSVSYESLTRRHGPSDAELRHHIRGHRSGTTPAPAADLGASE